MKMPSNSILIAFVLCAALSSQAQSKRSVDQITRPRTVASANSANTKTDNRANQRSASSETPQIAGKKAANHIQQDEARAIQREESSRRLSPNRLRIRISEAQRLMKARPVPTAMTPSLEFVTIAVSDGISMGHEGMRASLVSREVIADSVETVMFAERFDVGDLLKRKRRIKRD